MFAGHEAANAARCAKDFADLPGSALVVPEVLLAQKRIMVMECKPISHRAHLLCRATR